MKLFQTVKLQPLAFTAASDYHNEYRIVKNIDASIFFAAKRQVWQRMNVSFIRTTLIAMIIWQNNCVVLLSREAARRNALQRFRHHIIIIMISLSSPKMRWLGKLKMPGSSWNGWKTT